MSARAPWWNRIHRSGNLITGIDYSTCGDDAGGDYVYGGTWFCVNVNGPTVIARIMRIT